MTLDNFQYRSLDLHCFFQSIFLLCEENNVFLGEENQVFFYACYIQCCNCNKLQFYQSPSTVSTSAQLAPGIQKNLHLHLKINKLSPKAAASTNSMYNSDKYWSTVRTVVFFCLTMAYAVKWTERGRHYFFKCNKKNVKSPIILN